MRIMVSVDHMGRTGRRAGDRGASHGSIYEVDLTWRIAEGLYQAGRDSHDIIIASHGSYGERHRWANDQSAAVYLAMHINASTSPSASYGAFFYHPQTKKGRGDRLALLMARHVEQLARRRGDDAYKCKAISAEGDVWKNPRYTIAGLGRPVGICCEPFFISSPANRATFCQTSTLLELGRVYLAALEQWHATR